MDKFHVVAPTTLDNGRGGDYWYLDSGVTASGDGKSWSGAWKTLAEAVAAASNYDTILVKDGSVYDLGAAQNIGVTGLHLIGTGAVDHNFAKAMLYGGTGHFLTINAHEVWIDNIAFVSPLNNYDAIRVATTAAFFKIKISNCKFDLGNGEYCIKCDDTYDAPDLVIENNLFRSFSTGGIYLNTTRAKVKNNRFLILNAGTSAIEHVPNGGSRPDTVIEDNRIYGLNSTDIGIEITNTPTEAFLHISGNHIVNCATAISTGKYASWYDDNYLGTNQFNVGEVHTIKNPALLLNAAVKTAFTVAGGAIEILSYFGQCTVIFGSPSDFTIGIDAGAGTAYDGDFCTTVDCDGVIAGGTLRLLHADAETVLDIASKENAGSPLSIFCPAGNIIHTHTSATGAANWYMTFRALDSGVTVVAA